MFCFVVFGESDNRHTRRYLYRCDEVIKPGITVTVPAKNAVKPALVHSVFECMPSKVQIEEKKIKKIC